MAQELTPKNRLQVILVFFLVAFGRIIPSFRNLPSDPGYDFVRQVDEMGLRSLFAGPEGYLQIGPRLVALVANVFPLQHQAVVLSICATIVFVAVALLVCEIVSSQVGSKLVGLLCGLVVLLVPAAGESTVGNHGSVKWTLVVGLCVMLSSSRYISNHPRIALLVVLLVGLSAPLAVVVSAPLFFYAVRRFSESVQIHRVLLAVTFVLASIQFFFWQFSGNGSQIYGSTIQYTPWPGMGAFWYSIWLTPPIIAVISLLMVLFLRRDHVSSYFQFTVWISIGTIGVYLASYITTGIKDSTAVATQSLAWISLLGALFAAKDIISAAYIWKVAAVGTALFFGISIVKWYPASSYLSGGTSWRESIIAAKVQCEETGIEKVVVHLFLADVELSCTKISGST